MLETSPFVEVDMLESQDDFDPNLHQGRREDQVVSSQVESVIIFKIVGVGALIWAVFNILVFICVFIANKFS